MDSFESRKVTGKVVGKCVYLRREEREVDVDYTESVEGNIKGLHVLSH